MICSYRNDVNINFGWARKILVGFAGPHLANIQPAPNAASSGFSHAHTLRERARKAERSAAQAGNKRRCDAFRDVRLDSFSPFLANS